MGRLRLRFRLNSYMSQLKGGDLIDISRQVLAKKFLKGDLRKSKQ
jgi:hypothetical protein